MFIEELGMTAEVFDSQDAESLLLLACLEETAVASARLCIRMGADDLERAEVQWVAVLPEHRRQGVGAALLGTAESEALRRGLDAVHCHPPASLREAMSRVGYRSEDSWMVKQLW
ncbi:MAG: GNAT superfamily N-acetyltransferase [Myxococcota bacterium]